jgi:hypothetical protein
MTDPNTYEDYEVLDRLKLRRYELDGLLDLGIIAPVGRNASGRPLYCTATIETLTTRQQRERLRDALWWDFEPHPGRKDVRGRLWVPPVDLPHYPFDSEEQQAWARKVHRWKKRSAPFPFPRDRTARFKRLAEDKATKAFQRAHGIKRNRPKLRILVRRRPIKIGSRAELRNLVWSKTMIRAAADLGISEFTLRQICKHFQIPTPPRGHFNHKDPRDRMPRPPLPPFKRSNSASNL